MAATEANIDADRSRAVLSISGLSKAFPGVQALEDVHLDIGAGEILALMGENGAGKSTLIKLLTGVYAPDAGSLRFCGRLIHPTTPRSAEALGISTVHQEIHLIPNLSVADNIMLGRQPRRFGLIDHGALRSRARRALERLSIRVDVTRSVASLSTALQQMVAIARALAIDARLLILDEPTSSLDESETERLFEVMRRLRAEGLAIVFVTHFLDHVYAISDRIAVLRNGRLVGHYPCRELPRVRLVEAMLGAEQGAAHEARAGGASADAVAQDHMAEAPIAKDPISLPPFAAERATPALAAVGLERRGVVGPIDLEISAGEVVGLAGLLGSGRSETARMLFGVDPADQGDIVVGQRKLRLRTPREAIRVGLAYSAEDRKMDGIFPNLSLRENLILAMQAHRGLYRVLSWADQIGSVQHYMQALGIKAPSIETPIKLLSGGNQQKVLLARWLAMKPRVILLDEPTRGVDIGAKMEIEGLVRTLSRKGMATLLISSELEELARACSRVVILRDRKQLGELTGDRVQPRAIIQAIAHQAELKSDVR